MKQKFRLSFYLVVVVFVIIVVNLKAQGQAKIETLPVKTKMQNILSHIQELRPYVSDDDKFKDPKYQGLISDYLSDLSKMIKAAKHNQEMKTPAFSVSRQVLEDHFQEIERVFRIGNKSFARWQLNSSLPICMSCHTQLPSNSVSWKFFDAKAYKDDFEHAEYLFAARDFDGALNFYDKIIDGFPENKVKIQNLETATERKVAIFARVKRDFAAGAKSIEHSQANKNLPEFVAKNLTAWKEIFLGMKDKKLPDPKTASGNEIRNFVDSELKKVEWTKLLDITDARLVSNLTVSGILYEYLNYHPNNTLTPEVLLWLAQIDRDINNNFFFSLADLYLKKCMNEYTKHPAAKNCYNEYESNVFFSYTGSSGTSFPMDVEQELKSLRTKIFGTAKKVSKDK
jgi:hypothetical protein